MKSFIVQHQQGPDVSLCGVYSSKDIANEAIKDALKRYPYLSAQEFFIHERVTDKGIWIE